MRFEVLAPADLTVVDCNCSICTKTGYLHLLVEKSRFRLLKGAEALATYRFNTGAAQKYLEAVPFSLPRLDKEKPVDYERLIAAP